MDILEKYESFHDWYLLGVAVDMDKQVVDLQLIFDNKIDRVRLRFKGATRCLVDDFLIQNIIYSMEVLSVHESDAYKQALSRLDRSYPWGKDQPLKKIASIQATLGAELLVEFESMEAVPETES
ncbi:hypothetical protein [Paraburkholderia rhizosphaerae]|uniref:Uncharacterized protein n=1 Tax=Paraburkholderia rhizosphaerae TaxID=480658 RepID=A0A4V3HEA0_9BURK|nr:hypothetical protein [Paraburkholderia rhizosphaerae]TDY45115.1 hypothetical protein BX592_11582 [Paraburkholderia rhizosphaerae]